MTLVECANILLSKTCQCGRAKRGNTAFCHRCWTRLSGQTQRALYRKFGDGFEAAYARALEELGTAPSGRGARQ